MIFSRLGVTTRGHEDCPRMHPCINLDDRRCTFIICLLLPQHQHTLLRDIYSISRNLILSNGLYPAALSFYRPGPQAGPADESVVSLSTGRRRAIGNQGRARRATHPGDHAGHGYPHRRCPYASDESLLRFAGRGAGRGSGGALSS
jgi:hypothetical protein